MLSAVEYIKRTRMVTVNGEADSVRAHYGGKKNGVVLDVVVDRASVEAGGMEGLRSLIGGLVGDFKHHERATERLIMTIATRAESVNWNVTA
jgi:hypothetical protein